MVSSSTVVKFDVIRYLIVVLFNSNSRLFNGMNIYSQENEREREKTQKISSLSNTLLLYEIRNNLPLPRPVEHNTLNPI